jgi:hypothetical protein
MKIQNLFKCAVLAVAISLPTIQSEAQSVTQYHTDSLLANNLFLPVFPTNFVTSNYFFPTDPSTAVQGNGIFEIKSSGQDSAYPGQGGVTFQLLYTQTSPTNSAVPPNIPVTTNIVAQIGILLDTYTLGHIPVNLTNNAFTINLQVQSVGTNGVWSAIGQTAATNFLGCQYGKLLGFTAQGYTNGLVVQSFRAGYTQP